MDNPETLTTRMDNPETLVTPGIQNTGQIKVRKTKEVIKNRQCRDTDNKNGQSRDTDNKNGQSRELTTRMDNPETLTTLGAPDTGQRLQKTKGVIKNGQSRDTDNKNGTIQRHWCTRHRTKQKTKGVKGYTRHRTNPETLTTRMDNPETLNTGYTKHRTNKG